MLITKISTKLLVGVAKMGNYSMNKTLQAYLPASSYIFENCPKFPDREIVPIRKMICVHSVQY